MATASQGLDVTKMATEGFGQMMNSMDFFKRAWSSLATPFTPTLNVEELDKRITDLKAVEQWLSLNQNLLRSTIQGLEIQRGTLDAINTVTNTFGNAMKPSEDSLAQSLARQAAAAAQKAVEPPAPEAAASKAGGLFRPFDWSPFGMPSSMLPGFHTAQSSRIGSEEEDASGTKASAAAAAAPEADADGAGEGAAQDPADNAADESGSDAGSSAGSNAGSSAGSNAASNAGAGSERGASPQEAGAGGQVPGMNPLAWWEMLQENFRQIAQAAAGDLSRASAAAVSAATAGTDAVLKAGSGVTGTAARTGADNAAGRSRGAAGSSVSAGRGSRSGSGTGSATASRSRKAAASKGGSGANAAGTAAKRTRSKSRSSKDPG